MPKVELIAERWENRIGLACRHCEDEALFAVYRSNYRDWLFLCEKHKEKQLGNLARFMELSGKGSCLQWLGN